MRFEVLIGIIIFAFSIVEASILPSSAVFLEKHAKATKQTTSSRRSLKSRQPIQSTQSTPTRRPMLDRDEGFPFDETIQALTNNTSPSVFRLPYCSSPVIFTNDIADAQQTIYNCSSYAPAPYQIPSSFQGASPTVVLTQIVFNNLVQIDDVSETFTFDCKFRMTWNDNRYNITQLFPYLDNATAANGIEISQLYYSQTHPLEIWRPDLHFIDAQQVEVTAESLRIKQQGVIYWTRHLSITLSQPEFDYHNYPLDQQSAWFRFESFSYPMNLLRIGFVNPPVQFNEAPDSDQTSFSLNALWSYDSWDAGIDYPNYQITVNTPDRTFSAAYVKVIFNRRSAGILLRLALPIMFVAVLAGVMFWADMEKRLDFTVTLLLTISALYVSIIEGIPLVGYSTIMDTFVFSMFVILLFCVLLHISTYLMTKEAQTESIVEEIEGKVFGDRISNNLSHKSFPPAIPVVLQGTIRDKGVLRRKNVDVDSDDEERSNDSRPASDRSTEVKMKRIVSGQASVDRSIESVGKKRLRSRYFLTDCVILFGRLVIPVLPIFLAIGFYSSTLGGESIRTMLSIVFGFLYLIVCYVTVFVYSRKRLTKKMLLAVKLIRLDTDKGKNVMLFDLILLFLYEFFEKNQNKKNDQQDEISLTVNPMLEASWRNVSHDGASSMGEEDDIQLSKKRFIERSHAIMKASNVEEIDSSSSSSPVVQGNETFNQRQHYHESDVIFTKVSNQV